MKNIVKSLEHRIENLWKLLASLWKSFAYDGPLPPANFNIAACWREEKKKRSRHALAVKTDKRQKCRHQKIVCHFEKWGKNSFVYNTFPGQTYYELCKRAK